MSQEEVSRLVNDVMSRPDMLAEAMAIRDQAGMKTYITAKGYDLTRAEMADVWAMAAKVMAGRAEPMDATKERINTVKSTIQPKD